MNQGMNTKKAKDYNDLLFSRMRLYGVSAYDKNDELVSETGYSIPFKWLAVLFAKRYKMRTKANAVEIHEGTKRYGFYKFVGEV